MLPRFIKIACILFLVSFYANSQNNIQCKIETSLGEIIIELYPDKAPITVTNFMKYVDNNLYENSTFFRVCTPEYTMVTHLGLVTGEGDERAAVAHKVGVVMTQVPVSVAQSYESVAHDYGGALDVAQTVGGGGGRLARPHDAW